MSISKSRTSTQATEEVERLRARLEEAEQTLDAIRHGEVDALVVAGPQGDQIFSLAGAEHIYRVLVETMYEAALTVAMDGTILFCNRRFCELMKSTLPNAMGRKLAAFVAPEHAGEMSELLAAARTGPIRRHFVLRSADGIAVPVQIAATPLDGGESPTICVVVSDLTVLEGSARSIRDLREHEQAMEKAQTELRASRSAALNLMEDAILAHRQAEESAASLRQSEERYRILFETMSEGFAVHEIVTDAQGRPCNYRFLDVNPAFERFTGLKREELVGRLVLEVLPNTEPYWIENYGRVVLTGEPLHVEDYSSGLGRWYDVIAYRTSPGRFAVVFTDITERKRTHRELERSNDRLRLLSETATELLTTENPLIVVRDLCRTVMKHLDCQVFFNFLADEKTGRLYLNACAGISRKEFREIEWLDYGVAVCGCVARDGERIVAEDIPGHPNPQTALVASYGIQAYACHPLQAGGKTIGTLSFGTRMRTHFSEDDLSLMKIVADQVAIAMERIRSQQALQESREQLRQANERLEQQIEAKTQELRNTIDQLQDQVVGRVQAEGRLRRSLQMLEGFFQHTITPLAFLDRNFGFVRVNEAYAKADGKTPEFFRGKNHFELYPHDENRAIFEEVAQTGLPYRAYARPFTYPDRPSQVTYWDWQLTPLKDEQDEVQYLVLNLQDVTHRQLAVDELEHRAFQLQKLTLELSLAEDRERKRMAEILHDDLQQQLAAARFHLGTLHSAAGNGRMIQEITAQLDQILAYAIEQSRNLSHDLCPPVLHQSDLGETFEWLARQLLNRHGLTVHTEIRGFVDSQSDSIKVFLFRTGQEILFNAIKHAKVKEARLRLQRRDACLWLTVADRGQGFDPKTLKKTAGIGLLSIRERVGLLGGRMRIRSAPGRGSTFLIAVPDILIPEDREPPSDDSRVLFSSSVSRPTSPHSRLRVLLVDDHKVMREGLASLIGRQPDMEIVGQTGDGVSAIQLARELRPDVIVMDVAMPAMAGDEATRRIKMEMPQARVIALSMFDEPSIRTKMLNAGAGTYLSKVGPSEELLAAIRGS